MPARWCSRWDCGYSILRTSVLGQNFSVSLDIREGHILISKGRICGPSPSDVFGFLALGDRPIPFIADWFAGSAGILGFGILYLGRIGQEERLMLDTFGDDYRIYMNRTARIVPWIY